MKHFYILSISLLVILTFPGCSKHKDTSPEVLQAYNELLSELDTDLPGASYAALEQFASDHYRYDIVTTVKLELKKRQEGLDAAYLEGRDLAREEQFDEAEWILSDLATHVQDASAGKLAREYLKFEFPFMKATRLLMRGDVEAAEEVARELTRKKLNEKQMVEAQHLLDSISNANTGVRSAHSASLMAAARMLKVYIEMHYAEWGRYPEMLDLNSPAFASLNDNETFTRSVEAIEDYAATQDEFSLAVIGKHANERLRITDAGIEKGQPSP